MTFAFVPYCELTATRFGETAVPRLVAAARGYVAICSEFPRLYWAARASYDGHAPRHRVTLYEAERRIAVFDGSAHAINDVAFHPSEPVLAIATGGYDGGYSFDGELILWNWQTGAARSVFGESRAVVRCRWDGDRLAVVLQPRNDEEVPYAPAYFGTVLDDLQSIARYDHMSEEDPRLAGLQPIDPQTLGLPPYDYRTKSDEAAAYLRLLGVDPRARIWDVAFTSAGRIAVALDDGRIELWSPSGGRVIELRHDGVAVQLLRQPDRLLAHVIGERSTLLEVRDDGLVPWHELPGAYTCSVDATGRVLARDLGGRFDRVLSPTGEVLLETALGHYDCFNHFIRIDGGPHLYFLRGTPRHENKWLCVIDELHEIHQEMRWDTEQLHLMTSLAVLVEGDVVRSYVVHHPQGHGARIIERCSDEGVVWRHPVKAGATAMCAWPAAGAVAFALLDGTFGVLDAATGAVRHQERFLLDGVPTIIMALAVHDETIVIGTIQGRVLMFALR